MLPHLEGQAAQQPLSHLHLSRLEPDVGFPETYTEIRPNGEPADRSGTAEIVPLPTDGTLASEHLAAERERSRKAGRRAFAFGLERQLGTRRTSAHGSAWDSRGTGQRFHSQRMPVTS